MKFIKLYIKNFIYTKILPKIGAQFSCAQAGEDVVIDFLFKELRKKTISYLELGVNIPDASNNTYKFYLQGGKGVLVEADSSLISNIRQKRPNDKILNLGVSFSDDKEADFYIFNAKGINTFDKNEAELRLKDGNYKLLKVEKVKLAKINDIILENFKTFPDFLSIDIEGLDLEVLKTLDFNKFPIPIICAETCAFSENHIKPKDTSITEFMLKNGYFVYADTYINTIYVNEEWFYSKNR